MPFAFVHHFKNKRVVLASGSPRRREILSRIGLNFDVVPSKFPETLDKAKYAPSEYAVANATEKGLEVYGRLVVRILYYEDYNNENYFIFNININMIINIKARRSRS